MALGLLVSVSALASEQQISDLNFIQKSSTFLLDTGVNYNQNSNGGTKTTGISLDNKFTFGVSDRFNTGLSLAYMFSYKSKTSAGSSENETALSDVTLNNQYRLGQTSDGLVIDLLADLRISTKDREINGDAMLPVNEGRHSLNVGLNLGRKTSGFEWRTKASLKYNHESYYTNANNEDFENYQNSALDATIGSDFQWTLNEKLALGAGADLTYIGMRLDEREATGPVDKEFRQDPYSTLTLRTFALFKLSDSALLNLRLSYSPSAVIDTQETEVTNLNSVVKTESKTGNNTALFVGGKFLF
jgi:hypothetical protein